MINLTVGGALASLQEDVAALTAKMLRKELFVVISRVRGDPSRLRDLLPQHLSYIIDLEKKGVLFASGPFIDADGGPTGAGLTIFSTATIDEARELACRDPFVVAGIRDFELTKWILNEGAFRLTIHYSDQTIRLE